MELQAMNKQQLGAEQWADLAPYLAGLNVSEALEDFGRLADRVLAAPSIEPDQFHLQVATFDEHRYRQLNQPASLHSSSSYDYSAGSFYDDSAQLSPGTTSSCHSVTLPVWSQPSSPVASEHSLSSSSLTSSSSSLASSRCFSSASSSASSSICGDPDESRHGHGNRGHLHHHHHHHHLLRRSSPGIGKRGDRRRQNASAAGRYRQKQRGRQEILDEELELERLKQAKLMQSLEAKLELYREFANLLADNTRDPSQDFELARLGLCSLENILEHILPSQFLAQNESQRRELERLREHFKRVLDFSQFAAGR